MGLSRGREEMQNEECRMRKEGDRINPELRTRRGEMEVRVGFDGLAFTDHGRVFHDMTVEDFLVSRGLSFEDGILMRREGGELVFSRGDGHWHDGQKARSEDAAAGLKGGTLENPQLRPAIGGPMSGRGSTVGK